MKNRQEDSISDKPRPAWFGPAVMIALLVFVGLAGWGIQRFLSAEEQAPAAAPVEIPDRTPSTAATSPAPAPSGSGTSTEIFAWDCQADLSEEPASIIETAPIVDDWAMSSYSVIPLSNAGGCHKQPSGLRVGFAHTETGALMAAATYSVALDPSLNEAAAEDLEVAVVEGPDRQMLAERAKRIRDGLEPSSDGSALLGSTLVGYTQNRYSYEEASYQLVYSITDSNGLIQKVSGQVDLVWEGGDWKLDPASGTQLISGSKYQGAPYVKWGPVK